MNDNSNIPFDLEAYKLNLDKRLKEIIDTPTSILKKKTRIEKQTKKFIVKALR